MFEKKKKRFIVKESQGLGFGVMEILVDTETGVHYLVGQTPYGGMTPLLDEYGKVVIRKPPVEE